MPILKNRVEIYGKICDEVIGANLGELKTKTTSFENKREMNLDRQ